MSVAVSARPNESRRWWLLLQGAPGQVLAAAQVRYITGTPHEDERTAHARLAAMLLRS